MSNIDFFKNVQNFEEFAADSVIFEKDTEGATMYAVKEGEVNIVVGDKVLETVGEGGFFGEMALVDAEVRSAKAIAKTACKVVPVDRKRFMFLVKENPAFALQVMHVMAERIRKMNEMG